MDDHPSLSTESRCPNPFGIHRTEKILMVPSKGAIVPSKGGVFAKKDQKWLQLEEISNYSGKMIRPFGRTAIRCSRLNPGYFLLSTA
jgi:hypothetical protein